MAPKSVQRLKSMMHFYFCSPLKASTSARWKSNIPAIKLDLHPLRRSPSSFFIWSFRRDHITVYQTQMKSGPVHIKAMSFCSYHPLQPNQATLRQAKGSAIHFQAHFLLWLGDQSIPVFSLIRQTGLSAHLPLSRSLLPPSHTHTASH